MLFTNGIFSPQNVGDERTIKVLQGAVDRAAARVKPVDFIAAALECGDSRFNAALSQFLAQGAFLGDVREIVEICYGTGTVSSEFDGRREWFSEEALGALDEFDAVLEDHRESSKELILELLIACVLKYLNRQDRENLRLLDADRGAETLLKRYSDSVRALAPLIDVETGRLRSDEFTGSAWAVMENAGARASELGYDVILPPHCFLALLGESEGVAERLVRLQANPEISPGKVASAVKEVFRLSDQKSERAGLTREGLGEATVELLRAAQKMALLWGEERIDSPHLLAALLDTIPPRLSSVLGRAPLNISVEKMRQHLDQELKSDRKQGKKEVPVRLPVNLLSSEDLTYQARSGGIPEAVHFEKYFENMTRTLYRRRNNHLVITGQRGVGKTALVRELARKAAMGDIPFLRQKRFLLADCSGVTPAESRQKLEAILTNVSNRTDLILCLDGLGALLRAESGGNNKALLRNALKENRIKLIGLMSAWDFEDLLSSDHELLEYLSRIDMEEQSKANSIDIVGIARVRLEREYEVAIEDKAVERAVILSADYIMNERLPVKAIKILERICEDIDYERTQCQVSRTAVTTADVIRVVSEISGVPEGTLSGTGDEEANYERDLSLEVIGQDDAVRAVAAQLDLIKAGAVDPGKPASVMLFAGLTGVGKTELAKALAKFYSSSKRLQTYTMGNFTEPHSISGIIGVPPGYVGHDQGGRLINDLNSDPYCVFLLDEAEKAHPDIWKPFLNLFDEGWITDSRGVKAFADRAIFILTSNAGQETIAEMAEKSEKSEQIVEAVKEVLPKLKNERTGQQVFSPEFLARIKKVIIFKPLDEQAMKGICRKQIERIQKNWKEKKEKTIVVPDTLIDYIARQGHELDKKRHYKEGGRIVRKLISDLIEEPIQQEVKRNKLRFETGNIIELKFLSPVALPYQLAPAPKITVEFRSARADTPLECMGKVAALLKAGCQSGSRDSVYRVTSDCLARLDESLRQWATGHPGEPDGLPEGALDQFRKACVSLEQASARSEKQSELIIAELLSVLEGKGLA